MAKLKKLLALLLALVMVFCLAACGGNDEDEDKDDKKSSKKEKLSKEEQYLEDLEDLIDEIMEAADEGDEDKAYELGEELEALIEDGEEIYNELEEEDEDAAQKFQEDVMELLMEAYEALEEFEVDVNEDVDVEVETITDEEAIIGEWLCTFDLAPVMGDVLAEELGDESLIPTAELNMNIVFVFEAGGDAEITMEVDQTAMANYLDALAGNMVDYMYDMLAEMGYAQTDADEMIEAEFGMSMEEYIVAMMEESMAASVDSFSESMSCYYKVDADNQRIYLGETMEELESEAEYAAYAIYGDVLELTELVSADGDLDMTEMEEYGIELPWVFEKQ